MPRLQECPCGSGKWPTAHYDGWGIFMCYACPACEEDKLSGFRADIHDRYDCDEPIEED